MTVHDLGFKHFPAAHPPAQRAYLDATTRFSQSRADLVFADSRATAADLAHFYGTPASKIRVIYPGVDTANLKATAEDIAAVRAKYQLPKRYFIFIGTLQPRKNIERIVQAFARWQQSSDDNDAALVLAGGKGWLYDEAWLEGARATFGKPVTLARTTKPRCWAAPLLWSFPVCTKDSASLLWKP